MFYYAIARHPFQRQGPGIDLPGCRHLRILYSLVCWMLSGGNGLLLLWIMPAVNLFLIGALAWLGTTFAVRHGMSSWYGFLLPLAVNACLPALRNLTDELSTLAVLGLLLSLLTGSAGWQVVVWSGAAIFSREQNAAIVGLALAAALSQKRGRLALGLAGVLAAWFGWMLILRITYGAWPLLGSDGNSGPPFSGLYYGWTHLGGARGSVRLGIINGLSLAHWGLLMAVAMIVVGIGKAKGTVALFLAGGLLLSLVAGQYIFNDLFSYRRTLVWLPMGIWLVGVQSRSPWLLWALSPATVFSVAAVVHYA